MAGCAAAATFPLPLPDRFRDTPLLVIGFHDASPSQ